MVSMVSPPRPCRPLPVGDTLNVVALTDTHGWVEGHRHISRHSTAGRPVQLDATFGDVLSFYEQLSAKAQRKRAARTILALNGDLTDGTGLSLGAPPVKLLEIARRMPFGALTVGNHMLYHNENIDYVRSMARSWNGSLVTSNVDYASTGEPLGGSRYALVNDGSVLVLAFLYPMRDHGDAATVVDAAVAVNSSWFREAVTGRGFEAVLLMCHCDASDPTIGVVVDAVRSLRGPRLPIAVLAGHTHRRAYVAVDGQAAALEAGRYMDTVGFLSYDSERGFAHAFVDGSVEDMRAAACVDELATPRGEALKQHISETSFRLGLKEVVGCVNETFYARPTTAAEPPRALSRLFLDDVVPTTLFGGDARRRRLMMHYSSFRADLNAGAVLADDVYAMTPFQDSFWHVADNVDGGTVIDIVRDLYYNEDDPAGAGYFVQTVDPSETYELYAIRFEVDDVVGALRKRLVPNATKRIAFPGRNVTSLWFDYLRRGSRRQRCSSQVPPQATSGVVQAAAADDEVQTTPYLYEPHAYAARFVLFLLVFWLVRQRSRRCRASSKPGLPAAAPSPTSALAAPLRRLFFFAPVPAADREAMSGLGDGAELVAAA